MKKNCLILALILVLAPPLTETRRGETEGRWREGGEMEGKSTEWRTRERERRENEIKRERNVEEEPGRGGREEEEEEEEVAWVWLVNNTTTTTTTTARQVDKVDGRVANLTFEIRTQTHTLTLDVYVNRDLLGHTYRAQGKADTQVACDYQGHLRGDKSSLVAVSVCNGFWGVVYTGGGWVEVTPALHTHTLSGPHLLKNNKKQGKEEENNKNILNRVRRSLRGGGEVWARGNTSVVEVVVVVDSRAQGLVESEPSNEVSTEEATRRRVQAVINIVNALYRPLGIVTLLTHVEIWTKDKVKLTEKDSNATFKSFKKYFTTFKESNPGVPVDNMQVLTGVTFEEKVAGKGAVGAMCGGDSVGVSMFGTKGDSTGLRSPAEVAHTVAHEMGHNFGLNHVDEVKGCNCSGENCIMLSSGGWSYKSNTWDECSKKNISRLLQTVGLECLKNRPADFDLPSCGDGFLQDGEECDCGPREFCKHSCCDPETCKLASNATCGSGACCDLETCQPYTMSPRVECRPAVSSCDVAEFCDGRTEDCPADQWMSDGTACEVGRGFCYQGACGSAWGRCQQLWGADAEPCDREQHLTNKLGEKTGNCGYESDGTTLKACQESDVECGTLLCKSPTDEDKLASYFLRITWTSAKDCRAIVANQTYQQRAWLVPNGAACGNGKMCVDQYCVSRPTPLSTILFWLFLVITALLTLLCWDHCRYWWERQGGRNCCHVHLYYCAACLDCCCCPCMNRLNRMILSVVPPLLLPKIDCSKCLPSFNAGSPASPKDTRAATATEDAVCNGAGPGGGAEGPPTAGRQQQEGKVQDPSAGWGVENIVQTPPKGVVFKSLSPPRAAKPPGQIPPCEVPLLNPLYEAQHPPPPTGNPDMDEYLSATQIDLGDLRNPDDHRGAVIVPARPAPPPPAPSRALTDTHTVRPTPAIPPRPVLTHPLRPPVPHRQTSPVASNLQFAA